MKSWKSKTCDQYSSYIIFCLKSACCKNMDTFNATVNSVNNGAEFKNI